MLSNCRLNGSNRSGVEGFVHVSRDIQTEDIRIVAEKIF
jgi:hypothetical protein